jgi:uncharacterized protein YciI
MERRQTLFYEYVEDVVERRAPHREAHLEHIRAAREAGELVLAGTVGEPPHGAVIVFGDLPREHVEAFAREDPYVKAGLVRGWRVEPWNLI